MPDLNYSWITRARLVIEGQFEPVLIILILDPGQYSGLYILYFLTLINQCHEKMETTMITRLFGPRSKFDKSLPYTYEAKVPIAEGVDIYNFYLSDTICGLIEFLEHIEINPDDVEIFELFRNEENVIPHDLYTTKEGAWLHKPEICRSFKEHYKGHISEGTCSFKDRDRTGIGP